MGRHQQHAPVFFGQFLVRGARSQIAGSLKSAPSALVIDCAPSGKLGGSNAQEKVGSDLLKYAVG